MKTTNSKKYGRWYKVGDMSYPSITTVLGYPPPKQLLEWLKTATKEQKREPSRRGNALHSYAESIIKGEEPKPIDGDKYGKQISALSDNAFDYITDPLVQEKPMCSHKLM